jgi:hypothetical protein
MQHPVVESEEQRHIERTAVKAALSWSGWGSPVGLSILIISIGFFLVCLHWAGIVR